MNAVKADIAVWPTAKPMAVGTANPVSTQTG